MAYLLNQADMNGKTELNLSYIDEANRHFNSSNGLVHFKFHLLITGVQFFIIFSTLKYLTLIFQPFDVYYS